MTEILEPYEKRFGYFVVQKGFVTQQQLLEAMDIQITEELGNGKLRLIGEVLFDLDYMSLEQIDEALGLLMKD